MMLALESVKTGNMSINQVRNVEPSQPASSDLSGFSISDKEVRDGPGPGLAEVKTSGNSCGFSL